MFKQHWIDEVRRILHLAIPLIVSNMAIIGMEIIDTIMAGQASASDLAGLAIALRHKPFFSIMPLIIGGKVYAIKQFFYLR